MSNFYLVFLLIFTIQLLLFPNCNGDINIVEKSDGNHLIFSVEHGWDDVTPNWWGPEDLILMMESTAEGPCSADLPHPPKIEAKWILLTSDLNCNVDDIVINALRRGYKAVVIYPYGSYYQLKVSPGLKPHIHDINVYFVEENYGKLLRKYAYPFKNEDVFLVRFGKIGQNKLPPPPSSEWEMPPPPKKSPPKKPKYQKPAPPRQNDGGATRKGTVEQNELIVGTILFFGLIFLALERAGRPTPPPQEPEREPRPQPPPRPPPNIDPPPPPPRREPEEHEPGLFEAFILLDINFPLVK